MGEDGRRDRAVPLQCANAHVMIGSEAYGIHPCDMADRLTVEQRSGSNA